MRRSPVALVGFELCLDAVMPLTKGEAISGDETKENDGDLCNTPTRAPPREQWRAAPELDELKEVIGTRAQVLAAIKLQARRHAPRGAQPCMTARQRPCGRAAHPTLATPGVAAQAGRRGALALRRAAGSHRRGRPCRRAHGSDPRGTAAHRLGAPGAAAAHLQPHAGQRQRQRGRQPELAEVRPAPNP